MTTQNIKYKTIVLCLMFFLAGKSFFAQDISFLENNLKKLRFEITRGQVELDSLKEMLNSKAAQIEYLAGQESDQSELIKNLRAGSASLSTMIDLKQDSISESKIEYETLKNNLYNILTEKIDSLKKIPETEEIKRLINTYTQKKLLSVPKIFTLKFIPKKILELENKKQNKNVDEQIVNEYRSEALKEIENHISGITETYDQINGIIKLQEETDAFVEESEFNSDIAALSFFNNAQANAQSTEDFKNGVDLTGGDRFYDNANELTYNVYAYRVIFNQLNYAGIHVKNKWINPDSKTLSNFTLEEYKLFLDDLKTSLEEYRGILIRNQKGIDNK